MSPQTVVRPPAVAGSWYPGHAAALARAVDAYLQQAGQPPGGSIHGVIVPHAGLVYSGPVAAYAYRAVADRDYEVVALVGPSHHEMFDGVALFPSGVFETPLGPVPIAEAAAHEVAGHSTTIRALPEVHRREHCLEMQLPFLRRVLPEAAIVPLLMGSQTHETIADLANALAEGLRGRRALLIASTDLSHYHDSRTAARLDGRVLDLVRRFDADGLEKALDEFPYHACGGGPAVSVMRAARALGATEGAVLRYADSGDVSGDHTAVVGYLSAVFGVFESAGPPD